MDFDHDGILDLISGSYDPGDLYLFRGLGEGRYAKVQSILDKAGQPVVHHPEEFAKYQRMKDGPQANSDEAIEARVASFGSWVAPVDWDADGDLDLLIGSFGGDLFLRLNEGTRESPVYGTQSIPVEADGKPLHVNRHAAPAVADWNGDGLWDLVVGSADGAVGWYANTGLSGRPKFGPYQQLVSPAASLKFLEQHLRPGDTPIHGVRAQIFVTDYNLDGRLDLILGDYSDIHWLREMDDEQQAEFEALVKLQAKVIARIWKLSDQSYQEPENVQLKSHLATAQQAYQTIENQKKPLIESTKRASFIWLFLRSDGPSVQTVARAAPASPAPRGDTARSSDPVSLSATLEPVAGKSDRFQLTVALTIKTGWHLYGEVPEDAAEQITTVELQLPAGVRAEGEWARPSGVASLTDPHKSLYVGRAVFQRELSLTEPLGTEPIRFTVKYQACTDQFCLPPATLPGQVPVPR